MPPSSALVIFFLQTLLHNGQLVTQLVSLSCGCYASITRPCDPKSTCALPTARAQVFGAFVLVAIAVPVILPVFLPLLASFLWIRSRYIRASRDIKRWEAVTRSPIFASFSATIKVRRAERGGEGFVDAKCTHTHTLSFK